MLACLTGALILIAAGVQLFSGTLFGSPGALHNDEPRTSGVPIIVDNTVLER